MHGTKQTNKLKNIYVQASIAIATCSGEIQTLIEEMRKDDLESGYTYTKEITAVVEDLELGPKRRSVSFELSKVRLSKLLSYC